MKKTTHHLITEVLGRQPPLEMTIGIDLGDVWSHYCALNQEGGVVDRRRFRTTPKAIEKWFTDLPPARIAMEAGAHFHLDQNALVTTMVHQIASEPASAVPTGCRSVGDLGAPLFKLHQLA